MYPPRIFNSSSKGIWPQKLPSGCQKCEIEIEQYYINLYCRHLNNVCGSLHFKFQGNPCRIDWAMTFWSCPSKRRRKVAEERSREKYNKYLITVFVHHIVIHKLWVCDRICGDLKFDRKLDICGRLCDDFVGYKNGPLFLVRRGTEGHFHRLYCTNQTVGSQGVMRDGRERCMTKFTAIGDKWHQCWLYNILDIFHHLWCHVH